MVDSKEKKARQSTAQERVTSARLSRIERKSARLSSVAGKFNFDDVQAKIEEYEKAQEMGIPMKGSGSFLGGPSMGGNQRTSGVRKSGRPGSVYANFDFANVKSANTK